MRAIKDDLFIRGKVPMTKREIRVFINDCLNIKEGDLALDVGSGTGSVTIEMAMRGASVTAIETKDDAVELTRQNAQKFGLDIELIQGMAPDVIPDKKYDKVFIGGTRGNLKSICERVHRIMNDGGVICMTFIVLENASEALKILKTLFREVELNLIQTSNLDKIGMLRGNNPIFILRGVK